MKLIHVSDFHIGKRISEFSMIEDQKYILRQIAQTAVREKADGLLIAGDIYDRPVPPAEAVRVLDRFLTFLSENGIPVMAISGNHDSAERLSFGSELMSSSHIYFSPVYEGKVQKICLKDEWGEVWIHLLPFLRPAAVRKALGTEIASENDAVAAVLDHMETDLSERNVLVAHQFVTGAAVCESEELTAGGLDQVDGSLFEKFDYTALGHIHSPQKIGKDTIRYSGTPLKYSFSEVHQHKSMTVVELREKGNTTVRQIPLKPLHDMRKIKGTYMELTARSFYENTDTDDYICAVLTDEEDIPDGMQKLRTIYPNLMQLEYDNARTRADTRIDADKQVEKKSGEQLAEEFFELQNNSPMNAEQRKFVHMILERLREKEAGMEQGEQQ